MGCRHHSEDCSRWSEVYQQVGQSSSWEEAGEEERRTSGEEEEEERKRLRNWPRDR